MTRSPNPQLAAQALSTQSTHSILLSRLQGFDSAVQEIAHQAPKEDMYFWKVLDRDPLPRYHKGRMILLGDAAHPMQPTFGMGASFSIEDAGVLGVVMRGVRDKGQVEERLRLYEELRLQRASVMVLLSRGERMDAYELSEETKGLLRGVWPQESEWPGLTRQDVGAWAMALDCLADAQRAVETRFGGQDGVVQWKV